MTPPKCLKDLLIEDEQFRLKIYTDTKGKITGGIGRNLTDVGFSVDECLLMLDNDIRRANQAAQTFTWFSNLNPVRQDVIVSMIFNLGLGGFLEFKEMIQALYDGKNQTAAASMLDSKWASQVGKNEGERAYRLSQMMVTGTYP